MKRDSVGCMHKWSEHPESMNFVCTLCGSIGAKDPVKDPPNQNGLVVLRPGKEDLANMTHANRAAWYTQHKQQIPADVRDIGEWQTRHKWGIPSGTWSKLMKRFGCRSGAAEPPKHEVSLDTLPSFPEFSDSWPESVQLGWLEVYRALRLRER